MIRLVTILAALVASCVQGTIDIPVDSKFGQQLLSKARRLDQVEQQAYENAYGYEYYENEGEFDENWISGYSLKFQGCHQISQWNEVAENEDDVRIATKRLVRFRLCPTGSCNPSSSSGCTSNYGDYILDMNTFLLYYFEAKTAYQAFQCEYLASYGCNCQDMGDDEESCLYQCFTEHNMAALCMEGYADAQNNNNYNNNQDGEEVDDGANSFSLEDYMECSKSDYSDANGNSLYIGPYCASQGGGIFLGVFRDEACTNFADNTFGKTIYFESTGSSLPYAAASIVDMDCLSCQEPTDNNYDGNDADDADDVAQVCEAVYTLAGKCESHFSSGTLEYSNNAACNYMEGIKIVRKDGTVITADARANRTAAIFTGLFVVAFVLLSAYVYHLKTKLDRASINLAE